MNSRKYFYEVAGGDVGYIYTVDIQNLVVHIRQLHILDTLRLDSSVMR